MDIKQFGLEETILILSAADLEEAFKTIIKEVLADKAAESVVRLFAGANGFADCLDAWNGEPAAKARPDFSVRPNQLLLVTLGAMPADDPHVLAILDACERLLVPGGIRSLAAGDPKYRGRYEGAEDTCRKPAYHNGTVWAWPMPMFAEAAVKCGRLTRAQAGSLLAGVVENLNTNCRFGDRRWRCAACPEGV